MSELTVRLSELEDIIERGLATFIEVGMALLEIRDGDDGRGLYRQRGYSTFEDYCRERFEMSRSYAYRQIDAATVIEVLSPMGDVLPKTERVARELSPLLDEPEHLREVWARAVERGEQRPTSVDVMAVKAELTPSEPEPQGSEPGVRKLKQSHELVQGLSAHAESIQRIGEQLDLSTIQWIKQDYKEKEREWLTQDLIRELRNARTTLSRVIAALSSDA